jgi:hypothetical protein
MYCTQLKAFVLSHFRDYLTVFKTAYRGAMAIHRSERGWRLQTMSVKAHQYSHVLTEGHRDLIIYSCKVSIDLLRRAQLERFTDATLVTLELPLVRLHQRNCANITLPLPYGTRAAVLHTSESSHISPLTPLHSHQTSVQSAPPRCTGHRLKI